MKQFLVRRWFLIALLLVLVGGALLGGVPAFAALTDSKTFRYLLVATVLFLMAFPLEAKAMWQAASQPWAALLAVAVNFGVLPIVGYLVSRALVPDLANGLIVAAATPSTLASAAVWTRRAGGNDAVAILVTVLTNVSCFVVTPLWLFFLANAESTAEALQLGPMIQKLGLVVVAPMALAQLLRQWSPLRAWATARKTPLGVVAQCGVLSMIFLGAIRLGVKLFSEGPATLAATDVLMMIGAVLLVHLSMFFLAFAAGGWLGLSRADRIAASFSGSQKTLLVGLQVSMDLGFSILPMISYHVGQLLVDTVIADRLARSGGADNK